jgi:hypothetical protein
MRKIPQSAALPRFAHDEGLRRRGDRASAVTRDLLEMTELVIAHVAQNRELDRRMRRSVNATAVKRPWVVQASS